MATPQIPPRPSRSKSPAVPESTPSVPPRPTRSAVKTTDAEPEPTTIPESTELKQPIPISGTEQRPAPITKESSASTSSATSSRTPSLYKVSRDSETVEKDQNGIPHIGRRVPMYPHAGDVQAPTPSATPSGGKRKHVYREEWEMDDGAYSSQKSKTPYCECPGEALESSTRWIEVLGELWLTHN